MSVWPLLIAMNWVDPKHKTDKSSPSLFRIRA